VKLGEGRLGARRVGNGGGAKCGEEGRAPCPFIWSEGGAGRPDREGDRAAGGGGINAGGVGGRWLGLGEGGGPREEEGEWAGGRSHRPSRKEGGRAEIVARAQIQGNKGKIKF
jgi:hypothetical protein